MTQGRVEYKSMIPRGTDEGLDLWEAFVSQNRLYKILGKPHE